MNLRLSLQVQPEAKRMAVEIACEQHALIKEHAGVPDRRSSAEPGQNILGDNQLGLKQQESAQHRDSGKQVKRSR